MSNKKVISIRFARTISDQMTEEEWNSFVTLIPYFGDISTGGLTALALKYARDVHKPGDLYSFNSEMFERMCCEIKGLAMLTQSLKTGCLDRKLTLNSNQIKANLPLGTLIRYYPPYIITIEPTYQVRINIDLSEPLSFLTDDSSLTVITG